jgi:hypothetical protein
MNWTSKTERNITTNSTTHVVNIVFKHPVALIYLLYTI